MAGTTALLDAMTENGVPRLVFSSTAATYDEPDTIPITEDAPTRPTNTYGATKLAVDMMTTGECAATDLATVSLRYLMSPARPTGPVSGTAPKPGPRAPAAGDNTQTPLPAPDPWPRPGSAIWVGVSQTD